MVDSSRLPPSQVTKPSAPVTVLGDQSARVTRLPDPLTVLARAVRVEGEVVKQNTDGTVRVNTPQGDIDIQVRGRQPQPGQQLEIDIPAGRPPRQVTIRSAPEAPQQQRPNIPAPNLPVTTPPIQTRPTTPNAPPVDVKPAPTPGVPPAQNAPAPRPAIPAQPLPPQSAPPQQQPAPLPSNIPVRLLPVTPAQAQQIVQSVSQMMTILPTAPARAAFAANLIAQGAQDQNAQTLLQVKSTEVNMIAQQFTRTPLPVPQQGASFPTTPLNNLLQQVLNLPPGLIQNAATTATQVTPVAAAPVSIVPATGSLVSAPLATLIAFTPGMEKAAMQPSSFARIAQMDMRVLNIQPPSLTLPPIGGEGGVGGKIPAPTVMPQAPAGSVTAQVIGFTPQNLPLVTLLTPAGALPQNFILQFNAGNLQIGSTLTLQPQNVQIAPPGSTPATNAAMTPRMTALLSLFGPGPWPVMDEAYQTLLQTAPQMAQAFARALPSPGNPSQLGTAALLFIAAVRSGDIGSWLGDKKIDMLQRAGKNNLLSRLTQDLSTLAQRTAETPAVSSDWRPVPLPMFWDGQIQKIALYVKQDGGGRENDKKDGGQTRFIFDLDLDRMGGVQLDGLVREKRFDLVVRTQVPLSKSMRQVMKQNYTRALETTDLHGDLSFQGDIKNWVNVLQKEAAFGASA